MPDSGVPAGTIDAEVLDQAGRPLAGIEVELGIHFESIAEGSQRTTQQRTTDGQGKVRFESLSRELRYSYDLRIEHEGGFYAAAPFRLTQEKGQRVRLHVFPTTSDPRQALVGMRGFVYIRPREDVFQFEVLFRVLNMSTMSWLPKDVVMRLPRGFSAFESPPEGTTRFAEEPGRGARFDGTFAPGQHDVRLAFLVPSRGDSSQRFELSLPPHVAELRVIAEAAPGMTLNVEGFEPVQLTRGPSGDRVLVTRRLMRPGQAPEEAVRIDLGGLPTSGPARWIVVALAASIALGGLASAFSRRRGQKEASETLNDEDRRQAQEILLSELVALEKAFEAGDLGPRAHEQTRRQLIDALARLDKISA